MKRATVVLVLMVISVMFFTSCNSCERNNEKKFAVKQSQLKEAKEQIKITVNRYEQDLFSVREDFFVDDLKKIQKKYPFFLEGDIEDVRNQKQLWGYINDPMIKEVYEKSQKRFPNLNNMTSDLLDAMSYLKTYDSDVQIPNVYTYVSGFDYELPVKYMDNMLIIALDMFLGPNVNYYDQMGIPKYVSFRYQPEFILPESFKEISYSYLPSPKTRITMLDYMVFEGKKLYFAELMMPILHDSLLIGYPNQKLNWAIQNEGNIWAYLIENNLLYTKDNKAIVKFINDAPFTSVFARESPGRIGHWIGWQIVRSYMNSNEVNLLDMMKDENYRGILEKSRYKPKKNK